MGAHAFSTPEEAALAEWSAYPQVDVRVVRVEYSDDNTAVVITDTVPSHPMYKYCERNDSGWVFMSDSGPAVV